MAKANPNNSRIGIQGEAGSFHEEAMYQLGGDSGRMVNLETFSALYESLRNREIGSAVVAMANNRFGAIMESLNELMEGGFVIVGETYVSVRHQLLAVSGSSIEHIQEVHSQAPALGQCGEFLHSGILPDDYKRVEQEDTAGSARLIAELGDPTKAAIASQRAAEIYGLEILAADIQDDSDNITRFVQVERVNGQTHNSESNKTTVILETAQEPGSLARALTIFANQGVNLEDLNTGYIPNSPMRQRFLVEFDAGEQEKRVQDIYKELGATGCNITSLGSYVRAEMPTMQKENNDAQS